MNTSTTVPTGVARGRGHLPSLIRAAMAVLIMAAAFLSPASAMAATKEVPITSVSFPTAVTVKVGETKTLTVTTNPKNTTYLTNIEWGTQASGRFTSKSNGSGSYWGKASSETITGVKPGKGRLFTTVKVYDSNKCYVKTYTVNTTVTVVAADSQATKQASVPLQKISLSKSSLSLNTGATSRLTVAYTPTNTTVKKSVAWKSSNASVASVSNGVITAKKAGTATITATVGGKSATCKVTVNVPLKSISLSKTSATITEGGTQSLTVSYSPTNTTVKKSVAWKSSNTNVASASNGVITAKKAGTATITATIGGKSATCKVTVKAKAQQGGTSSGASGKTSTGGTSSSSASGTAGKATSKGSYRNVSDAYTYLNSFRTNKANQWYWNADNKTKKDVDSLKPLQRDAALEATARLRAEEAWRQLYVNDRATHDRPNGTSCYTAYPSGLKNWGENLSWGRTSSYEAITAWAETDKPYSGQAHRRNMLSSEFTRVGIACYEKDGKTCWAMCLGA